MMRTIVQLQAALISIAGFALWLAVGAAVRRNVYMLDGGLLLSPAFAMSLFAALGIAAMVILRGPMAVHSRERPNRLFVFAEGPLTLVVTATLIWIVTAWKIVGDTGQANPIDLSGGLPILLTLVVHGSLFYSLTLALLAGVVLMFAHAWRSTDS